MFELIFHPEADLELLELDSAMQGEAFAALDKLETQGNHLCFMHTDIIQDRLFKLRAGKNTLSVFLFSLKVKEYSFSVHS